ncbi:hypothetical protein ACS0TY_014217 [Phlomoides rotata]
MNSCKLTIKVVQFIFRLQIEGHSCGRDDMEFYRFNKKTFRFRLCFKTKDKLVSDVLFRMTFSGFRFWHHQQGGN